MQHQSAHASLAPTAICCCLLSLCFTVLPQQARAQATFSADSVVLFQGGGIDSDTASGPSPVTISSSVANGNGTAQATSVAERGFLRLSGFVNGVASKGTSGTFGNMFVEFRDVMIHRADGLPSIEDVAVTFQYFTNFEAAWSGPVPPFASLSGAGLGVTAQPSQGTNSFSETDSYTKDYFAPSTGTPGLETLAATLRTDTPFTLRLSFGANGLSARTGNSGQYDMSANVGPVVGEFTLASTERGFGAPVFLLPSGFTADSPEMNLINNQWQGVPEPAGLMLLCLGIAAVGRTRRAR